MKNNLIISLLVKISYLLPILVEVTPISGPDSKLVEEYARYKDDRYYFDENWEKVANLDQKAYN
jgi:hypothetical protein